MTVKVKVEGFRELDRALGDLTKAAARGAVRRAMKRSAEPILVAAEPNVPVDDGGLKESLSIASRLAPAVARSSRRLGDSKSSVQLFVGPSWPEGAHGHLVEFGTGPRYKKNGAYVGEMPAQPFLRPAWSAEMRPTLKRLAKYLGEEVQKSTERARRKAARAAAKRTQA